MEAVILARGCGSRLSKETDGASAGGFLMRVSRLLPKQALRAIDRVRTRWFLARLSSPTSESFGATDSRCAMARLPGCAISTVLKLRGQPRDEAARSYECQLHDVVAGWIAAEYPQPIDVGSAEGYYAVGFALAMPRTTVDAFDIDPAARAECTALAQLNASESGCESLAHASRPR